MRLGGVCGNVANIGSLPIDNSTLESCASAAVSTTSFTLAWKAWIHCATSSTLCLFDPKNYWCVLLFVLRHRGKKSETTAAVVVNQACEVERSAFKNSQS